MLYPHSCGGSEICCKCLSGPPGAGSLSSGRSELASFVPIAARLDAVLGNHWNGFACPGVVQETVRELIMALNARFATAVAVCAGLALAPAAHAERWHNGGAHYYHHNGGNAAGAAIIGGLVGVGVGAAIASGGYGYYAPPPVYYGAPGYYSAPAPPPVYYGYY